MKRQINQISESQFCKSWCFQYFNKINSKTRNFSKYSLLKITNELSIFRSLMLYIDMNMKYSLHDRINTNGKILIITLSSPTTIYRDYFES